MPLKVKVLGHRKTPTKQVVLSGTPRQFHKFLSRFRVNGQIIRNLKGYIFEEVVVCWITNTVAHYISFTG